jgi:hypothetical protein
LEGITYDIIPSTSTKRTTEITNIFSAKYFFPLFIEDAIGIL